MGIFDFFKNLSGKNETQEDAKKNSSDYSLPTIIPDKEIYECYDEIFRKMIVDISCMSSLEANEILSIITNSEGGCVNFYGYNSQVWEKFFKNKDWKWSEYDEWNGIFIKLGKFPLKFPTKTHSTPISIEEVLTTMKVSELKFLCVDNGLSTSSKTKKNDFVNLLKNIPKINHSEIIELKIKGIKERRKYDLYLLFMRTVFFRGKDLYDRRRAERLGLKKFDIIHTFEDEKEFIEIALKKNQNAIHPLFPSDTSMKKYEIEFN